MTLLTSASNGSIAELFDAQLALACRHVSRVLETLNSSLHRVMCCTVFINVPAVSHDSSVWSQWTHVETLLQTLIADNFARAEVNDDDEASDEQSVDSALKVSDCLCLLSISLALSIRNLIIVCLFL